MPALLHALPNAKPFTPAGYRIGYHRGATNHCPGCGHTHWIIGRSSAQCATCATAVPFAAPFASVFANAA